MNLRSGVQPVLAYLESALVGLLFILKTVIFRSLYFHKPLALVPRFASFAEKASCEFKFSLSLVLSLSCFRLCL
jgi:hypothetical protein